MNNNAPSILQASDLTSALLAHCMWKDEVAGEVYESDLHRVTDKEGNIHYEVDTKTIDLDLPDGGVPEVSHFEFDQFQDAVEHYINTTAMGIIIYDDQVKPT